MIVRFRMAEPADLRDVEACVEAAYRPYVPMLGVEPAPLKDDYARLIAEGAVEVVEDATGAFIGVLVRFVRPDHILIDNAALLPAMQRRGAMLRLYHRMVELARRHGVGKLRCFTNEKLTVNIDMYQRLGAVVTERRVLPDRVIIFMEMDISGAKGPGAADPKYLRSR
jgi:GNAT superfamily N-acetyltransferase